MKERYFDLMEKVLGAYTDEHIKRYFDEVKRDGVSEHGFPRLVANMGILIANGRRTDLTEIFEQMMDKCCLDYTRFRKVGQGNEFSVKEIIFCLLEIEKNKTFPKEKTDYWRSLLAKIKYSECYECYVEKKEDDIHNWGLFCALSEFMRGYIGVGETNEFVDTQLPSQLRLLDENKMYREPDEPIVYDLVPRSLFSTLLHFGYDGKYREEIDECLRKTGLLTLNMLSVNGEIPYGGRSNQFLHNDSLVTTIFEYEANRYAKEGNLKLAGQFKTAADKALSHMEQWISDEKITHIKNHFPTESKYGCEAYAYFDKYMITAASWLYVSALYCDESIKPCELDDCGKVFSLSKHFHKTFIRNGSWFAEVDTAADTEYDASGIGRIHKKGAPAQICLSVPGTSTPHYVVDVEGHSDFAIAPGVVKDGELKFAMRDDVKYELISSKAKDNFAEAKFECEFTDEEKVSLTCAVNADNVTVEAEGDDKVAVMLPAFCFDGKSYAEISVKDNILEICYKGYRCRYISSGEIADTGKVGCNRNGHYKLYYASGKKNVSVQIEIEKQK